MSSEHSRSMVMTYGRTFALGVATGLRSATALAVMTIAAQPERDRPLMRGIEQPWSRLATRPALYITGLCALGEYVGDKLPAAPARTAPAPLGGRIAFGSLVGSALSRAEGQSPALGAAIGALGALGGSFAGYAYRHVIATRTKLPDLPFAFLEDAAAIGISYLALQGSFTGKPEMVQAPDERDPTKVQR
jgi:uncharacterized membrane protein